MISLKSGIEDLCMCVCVVFACISSVCVAFACISSVCVCMCLCVLSYSIHVCNCSSYPLYSNHTGKVPVMAYQCLVVVMTSAKLDEKNRRK